MELLRRLYDEKFPQALYWGKKSGEPSRDAAFRFICTLLDEYAKTHAGEFARKPFASNVERASQLTGHKLPSHWQKIVDQYWSEYRKERAAQDARLPTIIEARNTGKHKFLQLATQLDDGSIPPEAIQVWRALKFDFATEWDLSQKSGVKLDVMCAWLPVLASRQLIAVIGTALAEPRYRRSPVRPTHPAMGPIWDELNRRPLISRIER